MKVIKDPALQQQSAADAVATSAPASAEGEAKGKAAAQETPIAGGEKDAAEAKVQQEIAELMTENDETEAPSVVVRTLEDIVEEEAREESVVPPSSFSLSRTLGGAIVARVIHKQIGLLLLIVGFLIIYITCRFACQKQLVEIDKLEQQLVVAHYKAVVFSSALTEKSRESNIINLLEMKGDSTLKVSTEPPYKINIPE